MAFLELSARQIKLFRAPAFAEARLLPEDEDGAHDEVTDKLIAGVDGEELHALFPKEGAGELHGGDKAEPDMEAGHQTKVQGIRTHAMENEGEHEGGKQAGNEGADIGRTGAFAHFVHFGLVVQVVAHFSGPGLGEEQWGVQRKPRIIVAIAAARMANQFKLCMCMRHLLVSDCGEKGGHYSMTRRAGMQRKRN